MGCLDILGTRVHVNTTISILAYCKVGIGTCICLTSIAICTFKESGEGRNVLILRYNCLVLDFFNNTFALYTSHL